MSKPNPFDYRMKKVLVETIDMNDLLDKFTESRSIESMAKFWNNLNTKYGNRIDIKIEMQYYETYKVYQLLLETAEEYTKRTNQLIKKRQNADLKKRQLVDELLALEKAEYLRLRAKFENI